MMERGFLSPQECKDGSTYIQKEISKHDISHNKIKKTFIITINVEQILTHFNKKKKKNIPNTVQARNIKTLPQVK